MDLITLGWDDYFARHFDSYRTDGLTPARVAQEHKGMYTIWAACGERRARVSGRFLHQATTRAEYPSVGDWVVIGNYRGDGDAIIQAVLPRRSCF